MPQLDTLPIAKRADSLQFEAEKKTLFKQLKELPPTELHFYFAQLVAIIENEPNPSKHSVLITKARKVVAALNLFYENQAALSQDATSAIPDLTQLTAAVNELILSSGMKTIPHKIKKGILLVCSAVLGFILGVVGAVLGFLGGLFSDYHPKKSLVASGYGFITGLVLGAFAGTRCLNVVFQSAFERKLESCIHHIEKVSKELSTKKSHKVYEEETKQYILETFFKGTKEEKEAAFESFISSKEEKIAVCTTTAGFLDRTLKGNLGHHGLIAYQINGLFKGPIEYGKPGKTPSFVEQNETPRVVTGRTLFNMMVLDRILVETYKYTKENFIKDYDIGTNDCKTYVDKILIGTNQAPTKITRFNKETDKWSGTHIVRPVVTFFSKMRDNELESIAPCYKDDEQTPDPLIKFRKWEGKDNVPSDSIPANLIASPSGFA